MGTVVVILIIAAIVGAVVWNKRTAAAAMAGVEFVVAATPEQVSSALAGAYSVGPGAKIKSKLMGIKLDGGGSSFRFSSNIGDHGAVTLTQNGSGTTVRAVTEELYVGSNPKSVSQRSSLWGFSSRLTHSIYGLLGVTPNASKMKRFQGGLESAITRQIRKSSKRR